MAGAQQALRYWTCFALAFGLIGKTSAVSLSVSVFSYNQVVQACAQCDDQFAVAVITYQNRFGVFSKAIDGAQYHCRKMVDVSQCYANCQAGSMYTYSSQNKRIFDLFYRDFCDPDCYTAILPFCYLQAFGSVDNSLTCNGNVMNNDLRECLRVEFFEKQNCSSACTPGQRKALYLFMQLQIPCFFPYSTQINCYTSVQYCTEKYFGDSGSDYSGLSNLILTNSTDVSCKYFSTDYINCLENALSGNISFGENSSVTTYERPCQSTEAQITFLEDFAEAFLAAPFCKANHTTLDAVCRTFITTTTARVTSATTARSTSTTSTAIARTATQTLATSTTTIRSTSTTSTTKARTTTLTTSTPSIGLTTAANTLQTTPFTAMQSLATNRNHTYFALEKGIIIEWLSLENSALSLMHVTRKFLDLHVPAVLLLLWLRHYINL